MNFALKLLGLFTLVLCFGLTLSDLNTICFQSKTCVHNNVEICGINSKIEHRRFLDTCDILEYNCLYGTDYLKTSKEDCASLPPLQ